jgi:hypothetical protein
LASSIPRKAYEILTTLNRNLTYSIARYGQKEGSGVSTIFNWYYQDDDSSFQLVDNTKAQAKKVYGTARRFQRGGFQQQQQQQQQYGGRGRSQNQGWQQTVRNQKMFAFFDFR